MFFPPSLSAQVYELLFSLEQNWIGDAASNSAVSRSLRLAALIAQAAGPAIVSSNFRLQMYLFRAYYDAHVQLRYSTELGSVTQASLVLAVAADSSEGAAEALQAATDTLLSAPVAVSMLLDKLEGQVRQMYALINATVGVFSMQCQQTDLGVNTLNAAITEKTFYLAQLPQIAKLPTEEQQLSAIASLLNWTDAGPGGVYACLGDTGNAGQISPLLDAGQGAESDPEFFYTPVINFDYGRSDFTTYRFSWSRWAGTFYDTLLNIDFGDLDKGACYMLRLVFGSTDDTPVQLLLNDGFALTPFFKKPDPLGPLVFELPCNSTSTGSLRVSCHQPSGIAGNGRNCQISEVWLVRNIT